MAVIKTSDETTAIARMRLLQIPGTAYFSWNFKD